MKKGNVFTELEVYKSAFQLQQEIFNLSKKWPAEEAYSLKDQIRRASRSVGANIAEAWAKRRYPAHFLTKLTDSDAELHETRHWLLTANECGYMVSPAFQELEAKLPSTGRQLGAMMNCHESFCFPPGSPRD